MKVNVLVNIAQINIENILCIALPNVEYFVIICLYLN